MTEEDSAYFTYKLDCLSVNGEINTKIYYKNNVIYKILNYKRDAKVSDEYRSATFSFPENNVLCFSPPRSIRYEKFKDDNYDLTDKIVANEMIEGVMINLFYDERISSWEISTKSAIGGNYCFYNNKSTKTFRRMFFDALRHKKHSFGGAFFDNLSRNYCYSFVLQHPDNEIISPVLQKKLYLVAVYDIHHDNRVTYIPPTVYEEWDLFKNVNGIIYFPDRYEFTTFSQLEDDMLSEKNSPLFLGKMLHNIETGERSYLKNSSRRNILKNRNSKYYYQYLCISRMNKQNDFLQYYPQFKLIYKNFTIEYEAFIKNVHNSYIKHYIAGEDNISEKYLPHIRAIHKTIYLPSHKTGRRTINKTAIHEYFDRMEPRELLYHLNYDRRLASQ
jgi:hypothetical protein